MTIREKIAEWRKGCSCASAGDPIGCRECTIGLIEAIDNYPSFAFEPGDHVRIKDLQQLGFVDRCLHRRNGHMEYCVQYWHQGTKQEAWCTEEEIQEATARPRLPRES